MVLRFYAVLLCSLLLIDVVTFVGVCCFLFVFVFVLCLFPIVFGWGRFCFVWVVWVGVFFGDLGGFFGDLGVLKT